MDKVNIANAEDMAELAEFGKKEFEQAVLEGELFKSVARKIEDAALEGRRDLVFIGSEEKLREILFIQKHLETLGYECGVVSKDILCFGIFKSSAHHLSISWELKESPGLVFKKHVFTFGYGHEHAGCHQVVYAEDDGVAALVMAKRHGRRWAFQYSGEKWEQMIGKGSFADNAALDMILYSQKYLEARGEIDEKHIR